MLARYLPMRRKALKPYRGRELDPKYLAWLRNQPCAVPGCTSHYIEAAHVGPRGFGVRCHDREAIPLCAGHHRNRADAHHRLGKRFWIFHELNRFDVIRDFNHRYETWIDCPTRICR
jgi:hypothetical protein